MSEKKQEVIHTKIWQEEAEHDNPFAAKACYCHGYDVYGDIIKNASWIEYLYLLFKGEQPTPEQARLLEGLAIAIANPGIRDHSVRAAMNGGVGGSGNAASLMAALAVGAGQYGGAREVAIAMEYWHYCDKDIEVWRERLTNPPQDERADVWLPMEHPPGFDPHGASCATPIRQTLNTLVECSPGMAVKWLNNQREILESIANCPLAMTGVSAAVFFDLELEPRQGEMLFLILRLPGAAVHAMEQRENGWRKYPFFHNAIYLENDPGAHVNPLDDK